MSTRGDRIREALAARGIRKQQALAAELKVHESAITRWKENKPISLGSAVALAATLDISLDWLLLGRGTIDAHRSHSAETGNDETMRQIMQHIGPRSLSLLLSAVKSIAEDFVSTGRD
jgi:transcriptional regulator with XRE-family HTH domain